MTRPLFRTVAVATSLLVTLGACGGSEGPRLDEQVRQDRVAGTVLHPTNSPTIDAPIKRAKPQPQPQSEPPARPERLTLWHYDAPVIPLAIEEGVLTPPDDPKVLGWWGRPAGARQGVTLLTGHAVSTGGGTFDDLEQIPLGAAAEVASHEYRVASVEIMSKEEVAQRARSLFNQGGDHRLVLVSCEDYDEKAGEWDSNVVVTLLPA